MQPAKFEVELTKPLVPYQAGTSVQVTVDWQRELFEAFSRLEIVYTKVTKDGKKVNSIPAHKVPEMVSFFTKKDDGCGRTDERSNIGGGVGSVSVWHGYYIHDMLHHYIYITEHRLKEMDQHTSYDDSGTQDLQIELSTSYIHIGAKAWCRTTTRLAEDEGVHRENHEMREVMQALLRSKEDSMRERDREGVGHEKSVRLPLGSRLTHSKHRVVEKTVIV